MQPCFDSYPTAADVQALLEASGVTITAGLGTQLLAYTAGAIREFEEAIDRKLLAPTATATRVFDPPTWESRLLFIDDLAAAPTAVVYQPQGGDAQALVLGTGYRLEPANALAKGEPITMLRMFRRWVEPLAWADQESIRVTGRWGYGTQIPADAWHAMVMGAAGLALLPVGAAATAGVRRRKIEDFEVDYGAGPYSAEISAWQGVVRGAIGRYRRMEWS